jgi:hypothetical protein
MEATLEQDLFCQAGAAGFRKSCIRCVWFCTRSISRNFNSLSIRFHRRVAGNSGTMPTPPITLQKITLLYKKTKLKIFPDLQNDMMHFYLFGQHACTRSFNGTRSMDQIHDHNLSSGRFYNSNSSVYEFLPVDSMPVHRCFQSKISRSMI